MKLVYEATDDRREERESHPKPNNNIIYIMGCRVDELLSAS
jgi:hypothetical protein